MINERGISEIHAEDIEVGVIYPENILINTDTMMDGIAYLMAGKPRKSFVELYRKEIIVGIIAICATVILILRMMR